MNARIEPVRRELGRAHCIVIKIGSKSLASSKTIFDDLARDCAALHARGCRVVLVSSGAIALGVRKLGLKSRPKEMPWLQAAAAAGQSQLMRAYEEAFSKHNLPVAQVLLTHADLADRSRANNARAALAALHEAGAIPILNENDSVTVDGIKFGDNDQLSSMVAPLVDSDLLLLLSDVEGVLRKTGERIATVRDVVTEVSPHVTSAKSDVGTGGMQSKVEAARRATIAGCNVVIADARVPGIVGQICNGQDVGTLFVAAPVRLSARKHWIAFTLRPKGALVLDAGCVSAMQSGKKSLLAVGVLGVRGAFEDGDPVSLVDGVGRELGRGLIRASATEAARVAGVSREAILVHRDDLVVFETTS
jgi:glutamate 5-kinase